MLIEKEEEEEKTLSYVFSLLPYYSMILMEDE